MTRDRLIKSCQTCLHNNVCKFTDEELCKGTKVKDLITDCKDYFANGVIVNHWISVEERLPNEELVKVKLLDWDVYPCLATIKSKRATGGRYVGKAYFCDGERFLTANCVDITNSITHWMPLPQPPKEVE